MERSPVSFLLKDVEGNEYLMNDCVCIQLAMYCWNIAFLAHIKFNDSVNFDLIKF